MTKDDILQVTTSVRQEIGEVRDTLQCGPNAGAVSILADQITRLAQCVEVLAEVPRKVVAESRWDKLQKKITACEHDWHEVRVENYSDRQCSKCGLRSP